MSSSSSSSSTSSVTGNDVNKAEIDPRLTFFVRGPRGTGKSMLMNALFAQNIQANWSGPSPLVVNVAKEQPEEADNRANVLDFSFRDLGNLFPLVEALKYRFIVASGDENADNIDLYAQYTKHASAVLLVMDKDKLECSKSQQSVLISAVKDLKAAHIHSQVSIPFIVIINKIEDLDDSDILEKFENYRDFVQDHLRSEGLWNQPVEFIAMSSLHSYLYRVFLSTSSFESLSEKEIVRFCGMELGGHGKVMAKDPQNYMTLANDITGRLNVSGARCRWQADCGLSSLITAVTKHVLTEKACFPLLKRRLALQLDLLPPPSILPPPPHSQQTESSTMKKTGENRELDVKTTPTSKFTASDNASSFTSRMPSMFNIGFTNNPLFSPGSPIHKNTNPQKLYSPLKKESSPKNDTAIPSFKTTTSTATIARSMDAAVRKYSSCPQDPGILKKNMTFIINLHSRYANLVPSIEEEKCSQQIPSSGGIDSVPSHPLYSADIESVRNTFRSDIQHVCTVHYRKNFTAYLKSLPQHADGNNVTKEMALLALKMIDSHERSDMMGMRSSESWNNARTKSIVMLLELIWSANVDQGFFSQPLSISSDREKIKSQVLVTLQILTASCEFASSHQGMTDRLVVHLFIPFIETLPNTIATMTLPANFNDSMEKKSADLFCTEEMEIPIEDESVFLDCKSEEAAEKQFLQNSRREIHAGFSISSSPMTTPPDDVSSSQQAKNEAITKEGILDSGYAKPAIVLVHIERCVLNLILGRDEDGCEESSEAALKLIRSLVSRKIDVRDKIVGYTTCFRELLWSHSDITQKTVYSSLHRQYFSLFFPIVHCSLPQIDEMWGQALASCVDYEKEIANFPFLDSERELILRAMLNIEVDIPPQFKGPPSAIKVSSTKGHTEKGRISSRGSVHSGMSDISDTATALSSADDSRHKRRSGKKSLRSNDNEVEEIRSKRKRREEDPSTMSLSTPSKKTDLSKATPPSKASTRSAVSSSAQKPQTTPSRMRIVRKFGEC